MKQELLDKYNVPVPRYTSYPPANYFTESFTGEDYLKAIEQSNQLSPKHLSFYFHIPFCRKMCYYCGCNSIPLSEHNVVTRFRYVEALHQEIELIAPYLAAKRKIAQIHYGGGTPSILPLMTLKSLNDHLRKDFTFINKPEIAIECHPGYLQEKDWIAFEEASFNRISIGVQDFNEEVLKKSNRKLSLLPIEEIVNALHASGIKVNLDFLYGLPGQTEQSFAATIERAIKIQPDRLVTFSYAHVPWVNKRQLLLEKAGLPSSEEKSRMYETARRMLCEAGYKPIGMDHFVRENDELYTALQNGQLHRNFQGYCTRRTTGQVYAFGVTGISQLTAAYAQNCKDVPEYIELMRQGRPATIKGYTLNEEEQIAREVIETLMCNYSINWLEIAERFSLPVSEIKQAVNYNKASLDEFAADGLIEFNDEQLKMTAEGRLFVRNVAASFDKLMLHTNKSFSKPV